MPPIRGQTSNWLKHSPKTLWKHQIWMVSIHAASVYHKLDKIFTLDIQYWINYYGFIAQSHPKRPLRSRLD